MIKLTVNIDDQASVKAVKAFLESMGLSYTIDDHLSTPAWWEDNALIQELDSRSADLKSGKDKGATFSEIKKNVVRR